jgi:glycosyltransferase involved in cell wall biosynthesis
MMLSGRRVAVVLGSLELGGAERQALLMATLLARDHGAAVAVFGMGAGKRVGELCRELGLDCRALPRVESRFAWRARARRRAAMARVRAFAPDLLLPFTAPANLACTLSRAASGACAAAWNQRDEGLGDAPEPLVRAALAGVGLALANGPGAVAYLRARGCARERILLLPNAVAPAAAGRPRDAWRAQLGAGAGDLVATMVANLSPAKDHLTLLTAWALRARRGPPGILALAGRDDGRGPALLAAVQRLGIAGSVRFLGPVADVAGLYAGSDLGVLCSASEGCPNAVLEAMAAGLAVTGSDIPGIAALVGGELLARPGDAPGLAARLDLLAGDEALRAAAGSRNRARASAEHAPRAIAERLAHALNGLLGGADPR